MDQVRTTVDQVLTILQDSGLKSDGRKRERTGQLREVIYPRFDFTEMAKRCLGSYWRQRTAEEQREFVKIFTDILEKSYVDRIESYNGEKIVYIREAEDKNYARVDTKVVTKKGEEFSLNYRLHAADGQWKVYDVVIDSISLVNNYRSQFNRILSSVSFEDLLERLQEKSKGWKLSPLRMDPNVPYWVLFAREGFSPKPLGAK